MLVAEDRHPDVTRAVQQGDLRHQPVCERLTGVVLAGETDHAEPGQVEPGRHPGEARAGAASAVLERRSSTVTVAGRSVSPTRTRR